MVTKGDEHLMAFRRSSKSLVGGCEKYEKNECDSETIFTQIVAKNSNRTEPNESHYFFHFGDSNQPSTVVTSNAKIIFVDLITYIFGALGTWIGFSFLQLNPVPHFIAINNDKAALGWKNTYRNIISRVRTHENNTRTVFRLHTDYLINVEERLSSLENHGSP